MVWRRSPTASPSAPTAYRRALGPRRRGFAASVRELSPRRTTLLPLATEIADKEASPHDHDTTPRDGRDPAGARVRVQHYMVRRGPDGSSCSRDLGQCLDQHDADPAREPPWQGSADRIL